VGAPQSSKWGGWDKKGNYAAGGFPVMQRCNNDHLPEAGNGSVGWASLRKTEMDWVKKGENRSKLLNENLAKAKGEKASTGGTSIGDGSAMKKELRMGGYL